MLLSACDTVMFFVPKHYHVKFGQSCLNASLFLSVRQTSHLDPINLNKIKYQQKSSNEIHNHDLDQLSPRFRRIDMNDEAWRLEKRTADELFSNSTIMTEGSLLNGYGRHQLSENVLKYAPGIIDVTETLKKDKKNHRHRRRKIVHSDSISAVTSDARKAVSDWNEEWDAGWDEESSKWTSSVEESLLKSRSGRAANPHLLKIDVSTLDFPKPIRMLSPAQLEDAIVAHFQKDMQIVQERTKSLQFKEEEKYISELTPVQLSPDVWHEFSARAEYVAPSMTSFQLLNITSHLSRAGVENTKVFSKLAAEVPVCIPAYTKTSQLIMLADAFAIQLKNKQGSRIFDGVFSIIVLRLNDLINSSNFKLSAEESLQLMDIYSRVAPHVEILNQIGSEVLTPMIYDLPTELLLQTVIVSLSMNSAVSETATLALGRYLSTFAFDAILNVPPHSQRDVEQRFIGISFSNDIRNRWNLESQVLTLCGKYGVRSLSNLPSLCREARNLREKIKMNVDGSVDGSMGFEYARRLSLPSKISSMNILRSLPQTETLVWSLLQKKVSSLLSAVFASSELKNFNQQFVENIRIQLTSSNQRQEAIEYSAKWIIPVSVNLTSLASLKSMSERLKARTLAASSSSLSLERDMPISVIDARKLLGVLQVLCEPHLALDNNSQDLEQLFKTVGISILCLAQNCSTASSSDLISALETGAQLLVLSSSLDGKHQSESQAAMRLACELLVMRASESIALRPNILPDEFAKVSAAVSFAISSVSNSSCLDAANNILLACTSCISAGDGLGSYASTIDDFQKILRLCRIANSNGDILVNHLLRVVGRKLQLGLVGKEVDVATVAKLLTDVLSLRHDEFFSGEERGALLIMGEYVGARVLGLNENEIKLELLHVLENSRSSLNGKRWDKVKTALESNEPLLTETTSN